MLRKLFGTTSLVGLDFQPDEVRIFYFKKWRQKRFILKAIAKALPELIFIEDKIQDWPKLSAFLRELVVEHQLEGYPTAICLPFNRVQSQKIVVPRNFSNQEIEQAIQHQLERDMLGITESLHIDFVEVSSTEIDTKTILFIVTRKEYLSQYIKCVNDAGLKVCIVDVDAYIWQRILSAYLSANAEQIGVALLYARSAFTLIAFNRKELFFCEVGQVGIEELVMTIAQKLKIYLANFAEPQHFIVCDKQTIPLNWQPVLNLMPAVQMHQFNLLSLFSFSEKSSMDLLNPNAFMLASGLADREKPVWA